MRYIKTSWIAVLALGVLATTACQPESSDKKGDPQINFGSDVLPVTTADAGDVLKLDIKGKSKDINNGFWVRFDSEGDSIAAWPFHVGEGKAYVMVPPMDGTTSREASLSIITDSGKRLDKHAQTLTIQPVNTNLSYTRASFDNAMGEGINKLVQMAIDCVDVLDSEGYMPLADANTIRGTLGQQKDMYASIALFTANLDDSELAILQQLLDNSKLLQFLADAGGVTLGSTGSQSSPQHSVLNAMIESALLKADFASFLIGEVRGALTLIAHLATQASGWPFIGNWMQNVANWATGLAASLKSTHDLINSMIPCDLVRLTATSQTMYVYMGQTGTVSVKGRYETEAEFNQQLFTTTISGYVNQAAGWVVTQMNQSQFLGQFSGYVQQVAQQVPGWIANWMQQNGLISTSVVPGQNFNVLSIDNFNMDMAQYRFDVAGITANLINLPYSAVNAFFSWIGIGVGNPVGQFAGVDIANTGVADYDPSNDKITTVARGNTTATYIGSLCRPSTSSFWGRWGFYHLGDTRTSVTVIVH